MSLFLDQILNSNRLIQIQNELNHADQIVLSFPKSGRTWVRSVLGEYLHLAYGVPVSKHLNSTNPEKVQLRKQMNCPLISFTHDYYSLERSNVSVWDKVQDELENFLFLDFYKKIPTIILLRDPVDCMVSFYHMHYNYTVDPFIDSIDEWFENSKYNIDYTCKWFDLLFNELKTIPNKLIVHYEDLKNSLDPWRQIIDFITHSCNLDLLKQSVDNNNFASAQSKEIQEYADKGKIIKNTNKLFVRQGGNNYLADLNENLQSIIENNDKIKQIQAKIKYAKTQNI